MSDPKVRDAVRSMDSKGCIKIEDRSPKGHLIRILLPSDLPVFLRSSPAHYEVMHELLHYRHFKDLGPNPFSREPLLSREQYVYDALRSRHWRSLNSMEQQHAIASIRSLGGKA